MTEWITTLYERYLQLFGDPDESTARPSTAPAAPTSGSPPAAVPSR